MSCKIKTILFSGISLPYTGIGSWTTSINYLINNRKSIDYIISPYGEIKLQHIKQFPIKNRNTFLDKLKVKCKIQSRFEAYLYQFHS